MDQFADVEAMQEAASSMLVPLRMSAPSGMPFRASLRAASIGPTAVGRVNCTTPGQVCRQPRIINSGDRHLVKVTLQRRGTAVVSQDGRQSLVGPGDLVAYDMNRPYEYVCTDPIEIAVIAMPWTMLGPCGDLFGRRTAIPVPGNRGIRAVIAAFFNGLTDTALSEGEADADGAGVSGADAVRLADTAASLIVTVFTGIPTERAEMPTGLGDQILSYALANLHDPGLSVESAARRFGISPRYLHTLMRGRDIRFGAWVRCERMKRIRQDLTDPRLANLTAAAIAARWGIRDADHLSRSLRAEFGLSAAEIRAGTGAF